jgi:hypothetical protein
MKKERLRCLFVLMVFADLNKYVKEEDNTTIKIK